MAQPAEGFPPPEITATAEAQMWFDQGLDLLHRRSGTHGATRVPSILDFGGSPLRADPRQESVNCATWVLDKFSAPNRLVATVVATPFV